MNRFIGLLQAFQFVKERVNVRLALVAVVLGVGGFAVYKGIQQIKPTGLPPHKKVASSGTSPAGAAPTQAGPGGEVALASGETPEAGGSLYPQESGASPAYGEGANESPAGGYTASTGNEGSGGGPGEYGGNPAPTYGETTGETPSPSVEEVPGTERAAPVNPYRPGPLPSATIGDGGQTDEPNAVVGAPETGYGEPSSEGQGYNGAGEDPAGAGPNANYGSTENTGTSESASEIAPYGAETEPAPLPRTVGTTPKSLASGPAGAATPRSLTAPPRGKGGSGNALPGERELEGMQAPAVALEKVAPAEVQVGKLATFETRVRNVGQAVAHDVVVTDHVPQGTRLESTNPPAQVGADGILTWNLGTMQPGDEVAISMQITPEAEGEIGSVAHVGLVGKATARTVSTRSLLTIEHDAPKKVMIGEAVPLRVTVTNPGSGAATGVIVEEDVPEGLSHVGGSELEYEIGVLRPGETRQMELTLKAEKPGLIQNTIVVRGEGNLLAQHQVEIEVISPQLQVGVAGPKKRYLDRQATYTLTVANPGTASAQEVELVAYLPKGMKFVQSDSEGQYDPAQHAVFWSLEELPAAKSGNVKLTTIPIETGEQMLRVEGRANLGLNVASEQAIQVDAAADLVFTISDLNDPIEVGTETVYEIRVANNGSKPATNVLLAAALPAELKLISGDGPARATTKGQQIGFEPVGRINPGEEMVFKIVAQGNRAGDHLIRVQLSSDEFPNPVTKEESTQVYVDR